jgi:capsular polysaccharide biosynthesis protein
MAVSRGFEVFRPEELSFPDQAALFRSASCILGEGGSGLHASVFADPGTIVASVGFNWVQCHVVGAFQQSIISMNRLQVSDRRPDRPYRFTARDEDLIGLLDQIDLALGKERRGVE